MNGFEDLEKKLKDIKRQTDVGTDEQILENAFAEFERSRKVRQSVYYIGPVVKTAAAVFILALIAGIAFLLFSNQTETPQQLVEEPPQKIEQPVQPEEEKQIEVAKDKEQKETTDKLKSDLEKVAALIQVDDTNGLLAMLEDEDVELLAQMLAANHLAQFGDLDTAKALEALSAKLFPDDPNNIFTISAKEIEKRLNLDSATEQESDTAEAKTGISGIVIDKSSYKPIHGAEIFYGSRKNPKSAFTDANGHFQFSDMEPQKRQFLYVIAKNHTSRRLTVDIIKDRFYQDFKIELTPGFKVAGTVWDQDQKPVKDATVATFHFTNHPFVTDSNGTFEIDGLDPAWGRYSLHVKHPNYPAFSTSFLPANTGETIWRDVVLKPGVTIYGQVTNINGDPVPDVDVGNTTSRCMWNCIEAKTDSNGKYELKNVDVGELVLWAVTSEYAPYVERFSLDGSQARKNIDIQLSEPVSLHGKIVDKQGNPVPGVSVSIREYKGVSNLANWQNRVSSDSEGKFVIPNAPPTGTVILELYSEQIPNTNPELETGLEKEHVITVDKVGKIYGKVIDDKTEEAIERFTVTLTFSKKGSKPRWGYSTTWSREGHNFDSSEGFFDTGSEGIPIEAEYSVTVYADGYDPLTIDPVVVQPISQDPNRTEFRLKPPTVLAGRVVDSNGMPIAGARIRILTDRNKFEHWDDRDTTITNSMGEFNLAGIGAEQRCIYVTAETFAPYICSSLDLPENPEGAVQITLEPGAEVFGRVIGPDGQGIADAKVNPHIFSKQMREMLSSPWPSLRATTTDTEGYYELFDLPAGNISFSVNSSTANGNLNLAQKKVTLESGQSLELNFGDEVGFTLTGVVRVGEKLLEGANIQMHFSDDSIKWGHTDSKGRFKITGVPEGTHRVYTSYHSGFDTETFQWGPGEQLSDNREVTVDGNVEINIDFGDGSVSGTIPDELTDNNDLQITAKCSVKHVEDKGDPSQSYWKYAGNAKIEPQGSFECANLKAGKYYLLLTSKNETLGITDVFELGESEHLEDIKFNFGNSVLHVYIIDSETMNGITNANFYLKNDLDAYFRSESLIPKDSKHGMVTDDKGIAEYPNLPKGRYKVLARTPGYLTAESEWINLSDGATGKVTVQLNRAAIAHFELSEETKKSITADTAYLLCRVTNVNTGELVPMTGVYGESEEHVVWLLPEEYMTQRRPVISLPEGKYEIKCHLYQDKKGVLTYKMQKPLFEGTVNAELNKGETQLIRISP